eukprot:1036472-Rhodomonas_salina.3
MLLLFWQGVLEIEGGGRYATDDPGCLPAIILPVHRLPHTLFAVPRLALSILPTSETQVKRERALIEAKKLERARKIKEENRIRKGLISAVRNQPTAGMARLNIEPSSPGILPPILLLFTILLSADAGSSLLSGSRTQGSSPAVTSRGGEAVSYTHLRAHETEADL